MDPDPALFGPLGPRSGMGKKKSISGSGMNILNHISEVFETIFWCLNTQVLWCGSGIWDPGTGIFLTRDPRWKNSDPGSALLIIDFVIGRAGPPGPLVQVHLLGGAVLPQGREGGQRPCAAGEVHQNIQGTVPLVCLFHEILLCVAYRPRYGTFCE